MFCYESVCTFANPQIHRPKDKESDKCLAVNSSNCVPSLSTPGGFAEIHQKFSMSHNNHHRRTAMNAAESVAKTVT